MPTSPDEMRRRIMGAIGAFEAKRKRQKDAPCPKCHVPSPEALHDLYCPSCGYNWRGVTDG